MRIGLTKRFALTKICIMDDHTKKKFLKTSKFVDKNGAFTKSMNTQLNLQLTTCITIIYDALYVCVESFV